MILDISYLTPSNAVYNSQAVISCACQMRETCNALHEKGGVCSRGCFASLYWLNSLSNHHSQSSAPMPWDRLKLSMQPSKYRNDASNSPQVDEQIYWIFSAK